MQNFKDSFTYPWVKFRRIFIFYINVIPILGQILYLGYMFRTVRILFEEHYDEVPSFGSFSENIRYGTKFIVFYLIWIFLLFSFYYIPKGGIFLIIIFIFMLPILTMQFIEKGQLRQGFNIFLSIHTIIMNLLDFLITSVKIMVITLIFIFLSIPIISLLITIPAWIMSVSFLMSQFYHYSEIWENNKNTEKLVVAMIDKSDSSKSHSIIKDEKIDIDKFLENLDA